MMDQLNMFEFTHEELPQKKVIKLGTFFSGIGAPEKALKNIGVDYELQFFSEIDKYAIQSYMSIHNESYDKCVGSITELKGSELPYCDMWFGGFPCQDISLAGKGKGFAFETESRSSLGWEMIRLLKEIDKKPMYVVFENVAAIFNNTHRPVLNLFKRDLEELGYTLYDKLLNSKDYGIPQNRNRYFLVAILGEYSYKFPRKQKLKLRLKDLLEDEVDEKYYLSDKQIQSIQSWNAQQKPLERMEQTNKEQISPTLLARGQEDMHSGLILIKEATKKGYVEAQDGDGIYINRPHQKRGVVQKGMTPKIKTSGDDIGVIVKGNYSPSNHNAASVVEKNGIAPTVMENHGTVTAVIDSLRIRKLTPKECFRLQGFSDTDYENAAMVCSNSQLYKQAGNSITVNVLEEIFKKLLVIE